MKTWCENGWLRPHTPRAKEVGQALAASDRDIADAQVDRISAEWRLSIAYNAILQAAAGALAASGYRASREQHHYRILQSLRHTIGLDQDTLDRLDSFRKKRHTGVYEAVGCVSDHEVQEIIALAVDLRHRIGDWLKRQHPDLLS